MLVLQIAGLAAAMVGVVWVERGDVLSGGPAIAIGVALILLGS